MSKPTDNTQTTPNEPGVNYNDYRNLTQEEKNAIATIAAPTPTTEELLVDWGVPRRKYSITFDGATGDTTINLADYGMEGAKYLNYRYVLGGGMAGTDVGIFMRINGVAFGGAYPGASINVPQGGAAITSADPNTWLVNSGATLGFSSTGLNALSVEGTIVQRGATGTVYVTARTHRARLGQSSIDYVERASSVNPNGALSTITLLARNNGSTTNHIPGTTFEIWYVG
jgi:hypothetical protein